MVCRYDLTLFPVRIHHRNIHCWASVIDYDPSFAVHTKIGQVFTYKLSTKTNFVRPGQSLNCLQGQKLPQVGGKLI